MKHYTKLRNREKIISKRKIECSVDILRTKGGKGREMKGR
jgi:hypothetical protein